MLKLKPIFSIRSWNSLSSYVGALIQIDWTSPLNFAFVNWGLPLISELAELFTNSIVEPSIGYSDMQGNEGMMETVNNLLSKRLTDLD
ncbi:MAG: hypothetical protein ACP5UZ_08480 [Thermoplasmata archaeon]